MTTYTFVAKASTTNVFWDDPTVWAGGVVPNASDADVLLPTATSGGSVYVSTINVNDGETFSTRSVGVTNNTLSVHSSTFLVSGDLAIGIGGTLILSGLAAVSAASLEVNGFGVSGRGHINISGMVSNAAGIVAATDGMTLTAGSLNNTGLLAASLGDLTVTVGGGGFANLSGSTLTGGTYSVGTLTNTTLFLNVGGLIGTDAATIVLAGGRNFFLRQRQQHLPSAGDDAANDFIVGNALTGRPHVQLGRSCRRRHAEPLPSWLRGSDF